MTTVFVAGATGSVGSAIVRELYNRSFHVRALARNRDRARSLLPFTDDIFTADATHDSFAGACTGVDVVISALGRSVSLNDRSRASYHDINYTANCRLLEEAKRSGVKKFIYVSAFKAEQLTHLAYFRAHHEFSEVLRSSGIDYAIIQPTAFFSAFDDVLVQAHKGRLACPGRGECRTNPIHQDDLATLCVDAIANSRTLIPVGGPGVYTRYALLELASRAAGRPRRIPRIPLELVNIFLPITRIFNRNMYDTLAFYMAVSSTDILAPQAGGRTLEEYFAERVPVLFSQQ